MSVFQKEREDETGMLIVEATIVFPIMFIIVFMLIYLGNAYSQKCIVESIINEAAIKGAAYCADPILQEIEARQNDLEEDEKIPSFSELKVDPYRYLIGGMETIKTYISEEVENRISGVGTGFFYGMAPDEQTTLKVEFNNHFLYSSFSVSAIYKIPLPIRMLFDDQELYLQVATCTDVPVSDVPEFIRNVNMVEDYMENYGIKQFIGEKVGNLVDSAKKLFGKGKTHEKEKE